MDQDHATRPARRGRHRLVRRSWLSWWWTQPPPVPVTEETRRALRSWLAREFSSISQPYIPRPRHIVVLPRPRCGPDTPRSHRCEGQFVART